MKKIVHLFIGLIILSMIFPSCDSSKIYEKNLNIPDGIWNVGHVAKFDVQISDSKIPYNLYVNIRNASLYPTNNIWLFVTTNSPQGKAQRDTVEFILANEKGEWLGDGAGDYWDSQLMYKKSVLFPSAGNFKLEIQHGMRMENLPFILEIGLRVEKAKIDTEKK